jgi:hypothetical protein
LCHVVSYMTLTGTEFDIAHIFTEQYLCQDVEGLIRDYVLSKDDMKEFKRLNKTGNNDALLLLFGAKNDALEVLRSSALYSWCELNDDEEFLNEIKSQWESEICGTCHKTIKVNNFGALVGTKHIQIPYCIECIPVGASGDK